MDEAVSAVDSDLRHLFSEARSTISTLRTLGEPETRPETSELSKNINALCKQLRGHLRSLEQLAEEQDTTDASLQVEQLVKEHKMSYERLKSGQENALSEMKKNSEIAWRKKRQELLSNGVSRSQMSDERSAVAASEGITESLRRTRQLMTEQIGATEGNTELIGTSASVLSKTNEKLKSQRRLFTSSRRLLNTMSWYDVLDKVVLYGGVGFFLIVVVYILQKRMLGLTPQFVKSSVHSIFSGSVEQASGIYQHYIRPAEVEDPAKPSPHFDDLHDIEGDEFIKAVPEVQSRHIEQESKLEKGIGDSVLHPDVMLEVDEIPKLIETEEPNIGMESEDPHIAAAPADDSADEDIAQDPETQAQAQDDFHSGETAVSQSMSPEPSAVEAHLVIPTETAQEIPAKLTESREKDPDVEEDPYEVDDEEQQEEADPYNVYPDPETEADLTGRVVKDEL